MRKTVVRQSAIVSALLLSGCVLRETRDARKEVTASYSAASATFKQEIGSVLNGGSYVGGNSIVTLVNGREIFPVMLAAIHNARRTIDLETYVMWDGEVAHQFAAALAERARAGVQVNVMLDAQGTHKMGSENLATLESAGAHVVKYHPFALWNPRAYNNRSHRKLMIVDGKLGFIGGVGLADEWQGNGASPDHWRDNHYKVTGPVVAEMQGAFMDNWLKTEHTVLSGPDYFPPLAPTGSSSAQVFWSSPRLGNMDIHLMYVLAIASAQHSLLIENAYFVPDDLLRKELIAAAKRGARVEIIVPGKHIDQQVVRIAQRKYWPELLRAGVRIFEYQPAMDHTKLMIVDGAFVSVGSANFDLRTLRLNDEANMNVIDRSFAAGQARIFAADKNRSREITLNSAGAMGFANPIEEAASVISPEL